jgi:outer membrane protein assembly factor BamB
MMPLNVISKMHDAIIRVEMWNSERRSKWLSESNRARRRRRWTRALGCLSVALLPVAAPATDWPQWCGTHGKNMVSEEKGLPESFVPGEKDSQDCGILPGTTQNVKWAVKLCQAIYSTPVVANGKVFLGGRKTGRGLLMCLDERTGKLLWQWEGSARKVPRYIDGWMIGIGAEPEGLGVCSTPVVQGKRVYFVTHSFKVMCLDVNSPVAESGPGPASVIWEYDLWDELGVFPCDACNGSPILDGDLLYVQTSNGIDHNMDPYREKNRKFPAPNAPNLIALDIKTGRLAATDDLKIADTILHGQWSNVSLGKVGGRKLVFFGGGDGLCYAFEALASVPAKPVKLKPVWWFDCNPAEYKKFGDVDRVTHFCLGDKRMKNNLNAANDGTFVGMSGIIGTPVFHNNRIYLAIGRDPAHGRGRGALHCIDATKTGDVTQTGRIWTYLGLERSLSTVSIADGLLYVCDVGGNLHCVNADSGQPYWNHATASEVWSSTLVADGKVYMPTPKGLFVLAAGKEKQILSQVNVGATIYAAPVAANGTLYIASRAGWLWAVYQGFPEK